MPAVEVTGLNVIAVYVSDLDRAKAFYVDRLGFEVSEDHGPGVLLSAGDVTLYLEGGRAPDVAPPTTQPEVSPCFAVESVRRAYENLKAAGVTVVTDYVKYAPTYALFRVADPDGNLIEFAGTP